MNNKTIWALIIIVVIVGGFIVLNKKPAEPVEKITLGIIAPMSGPATSAGESIKVATDLAAIKAGLAVKYEDDQCDAKKAVAAYDKLKNEGVKVFNVACSGSVLALAPLAKTDGNLILTSYAGSAEIRETGDEVIRFIPDALSVVDAMTAYFQTKASTTKYAIFSENQDYAASVTTKVKAALGSSVIVEENYVATDSDFRTQLTKIKNAKADYLVFIPTADKTAKIIYQQMKDLGLKTPVIGEVNTCDFPFSAADFGVPMTCWKATIENPQFTKFNEDFKAKAGKESAYAFYDAATYDVAIILGKLNTTVGNDVSEIKKNILAGVTGEISTYRFEPNGEVLGADYLKLINK